MEENWKKHKSGYWVSDLGEIKGKYVPFLKKSITNSGYALCGLGYVHRIVAETFLGDIPSGMVVNHKDANPANNRLCNLEIVTVSENIKHAYTMGNLVRPTGEINPMAELTQEDVLTMYADFKRGLNNQEIALKYRLHDRYVSLIRHGKRWKHLWDTHMVDSLNHNSLGNNPYSMDTCLEVIRLMVEEKKTNKELAELYMIDPSCISKIRHKKNWVNIWKIYLHQKIAATTIESTASTEGETGSE